MSIGVLDIPRIYVGTYAKYNSGSIEGNWLDLTDYSDKESFLEACAELHKDEADPEFMFQDFEGFPRAFYSESSVPETLFEFLELDEDERKIVALYAEAHGNSLVDDLDLDTAQEAYAGTASSEADFAENTAEELGEVPKGFPSWIVIDWEASWNCNLRHDYTSIHDSDSGNYYFFRDI